MHNNKYLGIVIVILMFLAGMLLVPIASMNLDLSFIPGDLRDGRLNNYFLEHGYKWISGQQNSFWDAPFFYPAPQVMTFSDNHLGTVLIYSVFRVLNFDRETSYQLWMLSIFCLNYFSAIYILNKMKFNIVGTTIGAYIFAFSLPITAQFGHDQLLPRFAIPIAIFYALKFCDTNDIKSLFILCLSVVFQFYCAIYTGYFLTLAIALLIIFYVLVNFGSNAVIRVLWGSSKEFIIRLLVIIISIFALLPLMYPYYRRAVFSAGNSWEEIATMLPRIQSYFLPSDYTWTWSWLLPIRDTLPMSWEHHIYTGLLPSLAFIAIPILYIRYRYTISLKIESIVFLTILLITLLTININGFTFYKSLYCLPGINAIRGISRIILIELFLFSILIASIVTFIYRKLEIISTLNKFVLIISLLFFTIFDQLIIISDNIHYSKSEAQERSQYVVNKVLSKDLNPKLFVYLPENSKDEAVVNTLDAMLAAQSLNIPTINGYSGHWPQDYHITVGRHDVCAGLIRWIGISNYRYGADSHADLFKDLIVIGGESCTNESNYLPSYTYYDKILPNYAFKADISMPSTQLVVNSGSPVIKIPVNIKNISTVIWPATVVKIVFRWLSIDGKPITNYKSQIFLPFDLYPGVIMNHNLQVDTPYNAGKYLLETDLIQENVGLFQEKGSQKALMKITVK